MTGDTMRISLSALLVTATMLADSLSTEAHHSFTGAYQVGKTITIKGKIVQIALRSPHSFFYVESQDTAPEVLLRRFYCPGCGALLDSETTLPGDPFLNDVVRP